MSGNNEYNLVSTFKENSLFLNENVENKFVNFIIEKLNILKTLPDSIRRILSNI